MRPTAILLILLTWVAAAEGAALLRAGAPVYAYVFNVGSQDVTVIDTGLDAVVDTRPLGAGVRWLSNEQDFWDGRHIWTYDMVAGQVHVIAIDPADMRVVRRRAVGQGPAHSVMLTPDRRHLLVNLAGENAIAVLERATLDLVRKIETGRFPCDLDAGADGVAFFPERDQDTVAALDLETFEIRGRVAFPAGAKPHMLRVAPDGGSLWVQTAVGGTNDVLDARGLTRLATRRLGRAPVTNAWTPDGRQAYVTHFAEDFISVLDAQSLDVVGRIAVGKQAANIGFHPDGRRAYVALAGEDKVAVIDTAAMTVIKKIPAGRQPWGLIIMSPPER